MSTRKSLKSNPGMHVALRLGDQTFACDITGVQEIVRNPQLEPSYDGPEILIGMFTGKRCELPVLDLLGRSPDECPLHEMTLVVLNYEGETVGLLVDDLEEIVELDLSKARPVGKGIVRWDLVDCVVSREGSDYNILNLGRVVDAFHSDGIQLAPGGEENERK
jgi:chemotaxis signal transduction protein